MEVSDKKIREYIRRLMLSRMRILCDNGFYGLLLMYADFALDESIDTAATDGRKIYFSPKFLDELTDCELDFILMHEIMHIALRHCNRHGKRDPENFNIACDIVVNSNILKSCKMNMSAITLGKYGVSVHVAPDGKEGYEYTAEEVYEMLPKRNSKRKQSGKGGEGEATEEKCAGKESSGSSGGVDNHTKWEDKSDDEEEEYEREIWEKRMADAAEAVEIRDPSNTYGGAPKCAERLLKELRNPQTDWRVMLNEFIEKLWLDDYSFMPPDRRFTDGDFFLPDLNGCEAEGDVKNILFMIDTSASMSDAAITAVYSEILGAIDQFGGRLNGWLGFFDAAVVKPKPFKNEEEFKIIRPYGGGGTSFRAIFEYVSSSMTDDLPACIIILTDGYAPYPSQSISKGIPVMWILDNEEVTPPWGKVARVTV